MTAALQSTLLPCLDGRSHVLFQQDNARPHIVRLTMDFPQEAGVNVLPWSPSSPDSNTIKDVWDIMERKLSTLHYPPQTLAQLIHEVEVFWNEMQKADISFYQSVQVCTRLRVAKFIIIFSDYLISCK